MFNFSIEISQLLSIIVLILLSVIYFKFKHLFRIGLIISLLFGVLNLISFTPFQASIGISDNIQIEVFSGILLLITLTTKRDVIN